MHPLFNLTGEFEDILPQSKAGVKGRQLLCFQDVLQF